MSTLQDRIAEVMSSSNKTVGEIAKIAQVSSSAVTQWKEGQTKTIKIEPAVLLERATGFSALWIAMGKGDKYAKNHLAIEEYEFAGKAASARKIQVIGTAKLGSDGFYEELSSVVGAGDGYIEMATEDDRAYCIRVRGQSMFPAIRDGWYVIVEPSGSVSPGEYVLIKLKTGQKMVKELLIKRPDRVEVISVNDGERLSFDIFELESIEPIAAVVPPSKWHPQ